MSESLPVQPEKKKKRPGCRMTEAEKIAKREQTSARKTKDAEEAEEIVSFTAMLLSQLITKGEVKKILRQRYADKQFSARTLETYISRAKRKVQQWGERPKVEVKFEVMQILRGLLQGSQKTHEKLQVIDRIVSIYGLAAPSEWQLTGKDGGPVEFKAENLSDDELARVVGQAVQQIQQQPEPNSSIPIEHTAEEEP